MKTEYKKGDVVILPNGETNIVDKCEHGIVYVLKFGFSWYYDAYYEKDVKLANEQEIDALYQSIKP